MTRLTKFPNGVESFLVDNNATAKDAAYTVIIATDSGKTFTNAETDGVVFTLPAIAKGTVVTFTNTAADGLAELSVSPNANDSITYINSAVDDKDIINTKATSQYGDFVTLGSFDGLVTWQVLAVRGIWAKE